MYEKSFSRGDVTHTNNTAGVFETADYVARADDIAALKIIAEAKQSTIRLSGDEKRRDYELTKLEISNLKLVLDSFAKMSKL
ncbi:hypothetical protein CPter291_3277 [Collimonas pratensis]|uniref:Uncharacterized protein n=1 Tax=Collimonas pratensis TaxID=279113 RepID=A0ABN4MG37_9BURK|nr:hypothetical protein CPter291_3277 [Collimonas pratensis]